MIATAYNTDRGRTHACVNGHVWPEEEGRNIVVIRADAGRAGRPDGAAGSNSMGDTQSGTADVRQKVRQLGPEWRKRTGFGGAAGKRNLFKIARELRRKK